MAFARAVRVLLLALGAAAGLVGCASVGYHSEAVASHGRFVTIENYSTDEIAPEQVDGLLAEVAQILGVQLDRKMPKAHIIVTNPSRIADLYRATTTGATYGAHAEALYFPGAGVVLIPYFDWTILGHELAHYVTDHYLRQTPREEWEHLAHMVERKLSDGPGALVAAGPVPATPATSE